jgi:hypothetical protein
MLEGGSALWIAAGEAMLSKISRSERAALVCWERAALVCWDLAAHACKYARSWLESQAGANQARA